MIWGRVHDNARSTPNPIHEFSPTDKVPECFSRLSLPAPRSLVPAVPSSTTTPTDSLYYSKKEERRAARRRAKEGPESGMHSAPKQGPGRGRALWREKTKTATFVPLPLNGAETVRGLERGWVVE